VNVNLRMCDFYHTNRFGSRGAPGHNTGLKGTHAGTRNTLFTDESHNHPNPPMRTRMTARRQRYRYGYVGT